MMPPWYINYIIMFYATFIFIIRRYQLRLRASKLRGWDELGVFFFGLMMGLIWPLTIGWLVATLPARPSKEERAARKAEKRARLELLAEQNERQARSLGVGE